MFSSSQPYLQDSEGLGGSNMRGHRQLFSTTVKTQRPTTLSANNEAVFLGFQIGIMLANVSTGHDLSLSIAALHLWGFGRSKLTEQSFQGHRVPL